MKRFGLEMVMHQLDSKFGEDLENEIRYIRQNDILKLTYKTTTYNNVPISIS